MRSLKFENAIRSIFADPVTNSPDHYNCLQPTYMCISINNLLLVNCPDI